jgi:hypothetical protein
MKKNYYGLPGWAWVLIVIGVLYVMRVESHPGYAASIKLGNGATFGVAEPEPLDMNPYSHHLAPTKIGKRQFSKVYGTELGINLTGVPTPPPVTQPYKNGDLGITGRGY